MPVPEPGNPGRPVTPQCACMTRLIKAARPVGLTRETEQGDHQHFPRIEHRGGPYRAMPRLHPSACRAGKPKEKMVEAAGVEPASE